MLTEADKKLEAVTCAKAWVRYERPYKFTESELAALLAKVREEDPIAKSISDALYIERTQDNLMLCAALREIYALFGEDEQIAKIVNTAIERYGV